MTVIPALRECLVKTTGFLGSLFPTLLYHLHPCRRAFAGMTEEAKVRNLSGMAKKLSGCRQTYPDPLRHSSEGWNPGGDAGMASMAGFPGWRVEWSSLPP